MDVTVLRNIHENYRTYRRGDVLCVPDARARRLAELGLVEWQAIMGRNPIKGQKTEVAWKELRKLVSARPSDGPLAFPTRRSRLDTLKDGEKLLILRKYGGLGDILISSMIFPMLADQYPGIHVTYACPQRYRTLFDQTGLTLTPYESVFDAASYEERGGTVRSEFLSAFDLVEDISIPCHIWETVFNQYGGSNGRGGNGLKWRNRLDMWSRWFGLAVKNPRTNIVIQEDERTAAKARLAETLGTGKPVCLIAPFSGNSIKCYPWFTELAHRIQADGWSVALLYSVAIPTDIQTITGLTLRQMGALCAVADLIISVDTSAFHWGGALGTPTLGIFNVNDGATYAKYYPTARAIQVCETPCLFSRYSPGGIRCAKHTTESLPIFPGLGMEMSRCYPSASTTRIAESVKAFWPTGKT